MVRHEVWVDVDRAYDSPVLMTTSLRSGEAMKEMCRLSQERMDDQINYTFSWHAF